MTTNELPDPRHALGIDKAAYQLVESSKGSMSSGGFDLAGLAFDKDRHYVYQLRSGGEVRYLFFDWYTAGSAWLASTPWAEGTRCMQNAIAYDAESQTYKSVDATKQLGDAFVSGLKEAFSKPLV